MKNTSLVRLACGVIVAQGAVGAYAQSVCLDAPGVHITGLLDVGADTTKKTEGNGSILATAVGRRERLSPSMTGTSSLAICGREDLGGKWRAGFVLDSQPTLDTGTLGQDGRMWGRQAYVSLTTPIGMIRAGRQYSSFFYAKAFSTTERLAGTDLFTGLLTINQLQVRQDNQISYWINSEDWLPKARLTASISYSPNAGVPSAGINAARAPATNAGTAQLLGGASAGDEDTNDRGKTFGGFINYQGYYDEARRLDQYSLSVGYHQNDFKVPLYLGPSTAIPLGILDDYKGYVVAARYWFPFNLGVAAAWGGGKYDFSAANPGLPQLLDDGIDIRSWVFGARYTTDRASSAGSWSVGGMYGVQEFRSFTRGKNKAAVLAAEYNFSKRTTAYARYGWIKDDAGETLAGFLNGGPEAILVATGLREVPAWNGVGVNPDGKSTVLSVGLRHSF